MIFFLLLLFVHSKLIHSTYEPNKYHLDLFDSICDNLPFNNDLKHSQTRNFSINESYFNEINHLTNIFSPYINQLPGQTIFSLYTLTSKQLNAKKKILFLTYYDQSIATYSLYSIAIQYLHLFISNFYLESNIWLDLLIFTQDYHHLYSQANKKQPDGRLEKISLLNYLFDFHKIILIEYDYILWFDVDLIVINSLFFQELDQLLTKYQAYDWLISSEYHASTGVANTGCFLFKSQSLWNQQFLKNWWNIDHSLGHDQILFDRLYKSYPLEEIQSRIKILPIRRFNSHPQPHLNQLPEDNILHLMGESNKFREIIFRQGLITFCQSIQAKDKNSSYQSSQSPVSYLNFIPKQLSLTQDVLFKAYWDYNQQQIQNILNQTQVLSTKVISNYNDDLEKTKYFLTFLDSFRLLREFLLQSSLQLRNTVLFSRNQYSTSMDQKTFKIQHIQNIERSMEILFNSFIDYLEFIGLTDLSHSFSLEIMSTPFPTIPKFSLGQLRVIIINPSIEWILNEFIHIIPTYGNDLFQEYNLILSQYLPSSIDQHENQRIIQITELYQNIETSFSNILSWLYFQYQIKSNALNIQICSILLQNKASFYLSEVDISWERYYPDSFNFSKRLSLAIYSYQQALELLKVFINSFPLEKLDPFHFPYLQLSLANTLCKYREKNSTFVSLSIPYYHEGIRKTYQILQYEQHIKENHHFLFNSINQSIECFHDYFHKYFHENSKAQLNSNFSIVVKDIHRIILSIKKQFPREDISLHQSILTNLIDQLNNSYETSGSAKNITKRLFKKRKRLILKV